MNVRGVIFLLLLVTVMSCANQVNNPAVTYSTRDYITVGKMMDSIHPPYIVDVSNGKKRIVFIGCDHNNDSTHPQYSAIEKYVTDLKPQIAFNEGGQIADSIHYHSLNDAASKDGETAALKFCTDQLGIRMMNGDTPFKTELPLALQRHSKEELYLYYVMERFAIPYHYGAYGKKLFDSVFAENAVPYLLKNDFPLSADEQKFAYFKKLYQQNLKQEFDILKPDLEAFDYINDHCRFCAVGRTSKMLRDSLLLDKISTALKTYDRVMITFGHGHALAVEPALQEIISQQFKK